HPRAGDHAGVGRHAPARRAAAARGEPSARPARGGGRGRLAPTGRALPATARRPAAPAREGARAARRAPAERHAQGDAPPVGERRPRLTLGRARGAPRARPWPPAGPAVIRERAPPALRRARHRCGRRRLATMRLAEIAAASRDVAATPARLAKVERLAMVLRALAPEEVPIAVAWLAGDPTQGRVGVGGAALRALPAVAPAERATLAIAEVDDALAALAGVRGAGAVAARARRLAALFAHATAEEQDFLRRLLLGELRQGALEGVMIEAIARAAGVAPDAVRGALTFAGSLPAVARAALTEGGAGLAAFRIEPGRPLAPMLAQSAADPAAALARLGRAAF